MTTRNPKKETAAGERRGHHDPESQSASTVREPEEDEDSFAGSGGERLEIQYSDTGSATISAITEDGPPRIIADGVTCMAASQPKRQKQYAPRRYIRLFHFGETLLATALLAWAASPVIAFILLVAYALGGLSDTACG